jgi:putative FmdB family regulatory protein
LRQIDSATRSPLRHTIKQCQRHLLLAPPDGTAPEYMPLYEFQCDRCSHRFEELVAAGVEERTCPECGSEHAGRVLSSPAASPKFVKTGTQNRRLEDKRGTNRGGALERFKQSRKRERGGS